MNMMIEAHEVSKRLGKSQALDRLDLRAESGQVLAVLGPNGSGKTTLVRLLATLIEPDGGELRVNGLDPVARPDEVRGQIALAGQYTAVEPTMTGRENLEMVAHLLGRSRRSARDAAAALLEQLDLVEAGDRRCSTYSGGMRRRLDLGASLIAAPRLLLLDERTTGLDPRSRSQLWDAIRSLVEAGTDVVLTTQYLEEADHLADQIVILDNGRSVASGSPTEIKALAGNRRIDVVLREPSQTELATRQLAAVGLAASDVDVTIGRIVIPATADGGGDLIRTVRQLDDSSVQLDEISMRQASLDEAFLDPVATASH